MAQRETAQGHTGPPVRRRVRPVALVLFAALLGLGPDAGAGQQAEDEPTWRTSGRVATEVRGFADGPAHAGQSDGGEGSFVLDPAFDAASHDGRHRFRVAPFLRVDGADAERTHFDVREAYWRAVWGDWELTTGVGRVFWGVTESRHLVDVVNQTDLVEDVDGEDKLGQPMVHLVTDRRFGRLEAFALLGFRERTFPGPDGRLRAPLPIDGSAAVYGSGAGRTRVDGALRWSHYFGDWDVGASWFHGTGREPQLIPDPTGAHLIPFYAVTDQLGVDVQYTRNAWLWKLEAIAREGQGATFGAAVAGFEYTIFQVGRSAADIGLLVEVLVDGRDRTAPTTIYDDDLFVGSRVAFNDAFGTRVLGGAVIDRNDGSVAAFVEAGRRFGRRATIELEVRWFTQVDATNALAVFARDSHAVVRVSRFF